MTEIAVGLVLIALAYLWGRRQGIRTERARYERGYQKAREAMTDATETVDGLSDAAVLERLRHHAGQRRL